MRIAALLKSSSGVVVLETILAACLQFGTFSVLVRVTSMETVGLWVLVNAILGFSRAADFWSRGLGSFVGEARGKGEDEEAASFVSTAVWSGVIGYGVLALLGAAVLYFFAAQIAGEAFAEPVREISPFIAVTFWLLAIAGTYSGAFLAFGKPSLKAAQTVCGGALFLIFVVLLAPRFGLWGILVAQAIQGGIILLFGAVAFHGFLTRGSPAFWSASQFRRLAVYGSKAIVVGSLQLAIEPVIRLLASQFGGLSAVAAVELASRLIAAVRNMITALGQILVPEFARLGAVSPHKSATLFRDVTRIFLVASLSAFSLLVSAAPALEELMLGKVGTGFVPFLWILSIGWFINTVTSSTYFLLVAHRRLQPLFWSNLIMTLGAILLGAGGGLLGGIQGALLGAAAAIIVSSLHLVIVSEERGRGILAYLDFLSNEPLRLMPVIAAFAAVVLLRASGLGQEDLWARICGYGFAIAVTGAACLVFGDIRRVIRTAARIH